jgi:hypothetical protein
LRIIKLQVFSEVIAVGDAVGEYYDSASNMSGIA